jgi:hypothetical protein
MLPVASGRQVRQQDGRDVIVLPEGDRPAHLARGPHRGPVVGPASTIPPNWDRYDSCQTGRTSGSAVSTHRGSADRGTDVRELSTPEEQCVPDWRDGAQSTTPTPFGTAVSAEQRAQPDRAAMDG